jgi:alkylation response protein AidB-like acyl-CoA dehydrogenase
VKGEVLGGVWRNTAGASTATSFAANIKRGKDNEEERVMLLTKDQLTISPDGVMMGLLGAECLDIELTDVPANDNRIFSREVQHAKVNGSLYQFPYTQIAETVVAVSISGMATHFIDLSKGIFAETRNSDGVPMTEDLNVQETLRKSSQKFDDARTKMFYAVELSWRALQNGHQIKPAILYKVSTAAADLARKARECVDAIYPYCGLDAADKRSDINRVWRDIHTASLYGIALTGIAE